MCCVKDVLRERCFLSAHRGASTPKILTTGRPILVAPIYVDHRKPSSRIFSDATAHVGLNLGAFLRTGFDGRAADGPRGQMLSVEHAPGRHPESFHARKV